MVKRGQRQGGPAVSPRPGGVVRPRAGRAGRLAQRFFREGSLEGGRRIGIPARPSQVRAGKYPLRGDNPGQHRRKKERGEGVKERRERSQRRPAQERLGAVVLGAPPRRYRGARKRRWSRATCRRVAPRVLPRSPTAAVITLSMYSERLCLTLTAEE